MLGWGEQFIKTWLAWPQFDQRDHAFCPVLDQASTDSDAPDFSLHAEHTPYVEGKRMGGDGQRSYITEWKFMTPKTDSMAQATRTLSLHTWVMAAKGEEARA